MPVTLPPPREGRVGPPEWARRFLIRGAQLSERVRRRGFSNGGGILFSFFFYHTQYERLDESGAVFLVHVDVYATRYSDYRVFPSERPD